MKHLAKTLVLITIFIVNLGGSTQAASTYIPPNAIPLLPEVRTAILDLEVEFCYDLMAASIEQESCLSLTHSKCWSTESQLLTYWNKAKGIRREQGIGLGQFTRAWRSNGDLRFDTLSELARTYPKQLAGFNWSTARSSPLLQIKAMALLMNETHGKLPKEASMEARDAMTISAYNAGKKRLAEDRRTCQIKQACDPNQWWGNVETIKAPGFATEPLYGWASAWDLNRHHVKKVMKERRPKYTDWFKDREPNPIPSCLN